MRLYPEKLEQQLSNSLTPLYIIYGDEPLQRTEALDLLRSRFQAAGYETSNRFEAVKGFNWDPLFAKCAERGLFCDRQLLEIEFTQKPDQSQSKQLIELASQLSDECALLLLLPKLTSAQLNQNWFTTLDKQGITIPVNPPDSSRLPGWVSHRLRRHQLQAEPALISRLCYHFEGNLLGLDQAIIQLQLLGDTGTGLCEQLDSIISSDPRFNLFQLCDTLLGGDIATGLRILEQLAAEDHSPIMIAWSLNRELLQLLEFQEQLAKGEALPALCKKAGIWQQRQQLIKSALERLPIEQLYQLLRYAALLDRQLKQQQGGDPFIELATLCSGFAGKLPLAIAAEL